MPYEGRLFVMSDESIARTASEVLDSRVIGQESVALLTGRFRVNLRAWKNPDLLRASHVFLSSR